MPICRSKRMRDTVTASISIDFENGSIGSGTSGEVSHSVQNTITCLQQRTHWMTGTTRRHAKRSKGLVSDGRTWCESKNIPGEGGASIIIHSIQTAIRGLYHRAHGATFYRTITKPLQRGKCRSIFFDRKDNSFRIAA